MATQNYRITELEEGQELIYSDHPCVSYNFLDTEGNNIFNIC